MISHFYQELVKMSIDVRATQQLSRATSPGIKLLSASNKAKNLNPTFQVSQSNPKPIFNSKGPSISKPMPNFPYQKPAMKGGLRDSTVAKPSATTNMQV